METGNSNGQPNDLVLRAARGETTERTPVWMMRQAGRTDPEYRELRARSGLPLEDLFRNPECAIEISLLPRRIGVDAIIFFQDILPPLSPMGVDFVFRPGPVLENPIRTKADIDRLVLYDPSEELPFVGKTLSALRRELDGSLPLLGFAGAPLTLLFFMVEGGTPGRGVTALSLLSREPSVAHNLLENLTEMTCRYLLYQIESGAQAVQLFESVADLLTERIYAEFALPYQQQIFNRLQDRVPTILFAKGFDSLELMNRSGAKVLSISNRFSVSQARDRLGQEVAIQGNVSNRILATGSPEDIESAVKDCIVSGGSRGHILNLDHGLLRETPWENVQEFVRAAKGTASGAELTKTA
jgi:uroporphyrinogen decarboxylase